MVREGGGGGWDLGDLGPIGGSKVKGQSPILVLLVPDLEERVPGACAHGHSIFGDAQTGDPVVVTGQHA